MARPRLGEVGAAEAHDRREGHSRPRRQELRERAQAARLSMWRPTCAAGGWGSGCADRVGAPPGGGGAAGVEPDRGESQSNGAGAQLGSIVSSPGQETQKVVERVGELVAKLLAGESGVMVVKMSAPGRSFGGVADYCLHDPRDAGGGPPSRERGAGGVDRDPQPGDEARESGRAGSWQPQPRRPRSLKHLAGVRGDGAEAGEAGVPLFAELGQG